MKKEVQVRHEHPVYVGFNLTFTGIHKIIFHDMQAVELLMKQKTKKCYEQLPNVFVIPPLALVLTYIQCSDRQKNCMVIRS